MTSFTKSFFQFLAGFLGLVLFGLLVVFAAGFYEVEILRKSKEIAAPPDSKNLVNGTTRSENVPPR
jgi:hypothetical protein